MDNSFKRFGIDHLSASALNLWRAAPGVYALRYIAKIKDAGNPAMWRGTAVENGLGALLKSNDITIANGIAHQNFDMNCQGETSDDIDTERELISPMLEQCLYWKPPSPLMATQLRIEHYIGDIPIPIIGYLDLAFEGIDIDLKTTKSLPSTPRPDHIRQVSLYRAARNKAGGVLYVTGKRHAYYDIDDDQMERALGDLAADARCLSNFLARMDTKEDVLRSLPIDFENYQAPKIRVPLAEILLAG